MSIKKIDHHFTKARVKAVIFCVILAGLLAILICDGFNTKVFSEIHSEEGVGLMQANSYKTVSSSSEIAQDYADSESDIHLAIVCGGYSSTRSLYVLLKSILFYRTDTINLHLFVDNISHQILKELFSSWLVDDLVVHYYNLTNYEREVFWITNSHYSHRYGLMKLELVSVLAERENLQKIIILDTDMLVLGNIRYAWKEFEKFASPSDDELIKRPIFAMVENQSDWYLDESSGRPTHPLSVWPALGRGFNSGTILVDLAQLRSKIDWRALWRQEAEIQLASHLSTTLADQDIFNAIFKSRSWLVHKLPCAFNVQLNEHSRLEEVCTKRSNKLQIVHWNSPRKLDTTNPSAKLFKNWYINFRNWDAKLLETSKPEKNLEGKSKDWTPKLRDLSDQTKLYCDNMRPKLEDRLRVYPYFMEFDFEAAEGDVTYVVHLSMDRLQVLDELVQNWQGPISAAIYLPEQETDLLMSFIGGSNSLNTRKNIGYHLVFRDYGFNYPINRMRNIALKHTVTPYVFLCDVDFLPSLGLHDYLKQSILRIEREQGSGAMHNKALIVPAFESSEYKFAFPADKQELKTQLNLGEVSEFRHQIWPKGHKQTNFEKWKSSSSVYEVEWTRDFEPFIVTRRDVPRFDERFIGFGYNKVEHITQLAAFGYKFLVLPEAFVIHRIHPPSFDIKKHRGSIFYKVCINDLKKAFLEELRAKYPNFMNEVYAHSEHYDNEVETIHIGPNAIITSKLIKYD